MPSELMGLEDFLISGSTCTGRSEDRKEDNLSLDFNVKSDKKQDQLTQSASMLAEK